MPRQYRKTPKTDRMIPLHVNITADQALALEIISDRRMVRVAALVRSALDKYLREQDVGYGMKIEAAQHHTKGNGTG